MHLLTVTSIWQLITMGLITVIYTWQLNLVPSRCLSTACACVRVGPQGCKGRDPFWPLNGPVATAATPDHPTHQDSPALRAVYPHPALASGAGPKGAKGRIVLASSRANGCCRCLLPEPLLQFLEPLLGRSMPGSPSPSPSPCGPHMLQPPKSHPRPLTCEEACNSTFRIWQCSEAGRADLK
jgi:hypothetical protein